MTKYKMNQVMYFKHGYIVGKCKIDEIIEHHKQDEEIVKYCVHAYGIENYITLDETELYDDLVQAIKDAQVALKNEYEAKSARLGNLSYDDYVKTLDEQKKKIEDAYLTSVENLNKIDDEYFEEKEREYLKEKKEK